MDIRNIYVITGYSFYTYKRLIMTSTLRSFFASMALIACYDVHATEIYDYSASYGAYTISGTFDATATGSTLSMPTNITVLVNGVDPGNFGTPFIDGWDTPTASAIFSLTPGASDFSIIDNEGPTTIEAGFHDPSGGGALGQLYLSGPLGNPGWVAETSQLSIVLDPASAPEPATFLLAGVGLACLAWSRRKYGRPA